MYKNIGFLRQLLGLLGLVTLVCHFIEPQNSPWIVIVDNVVPALVVMVVWVLPFDAFMARVFLSERAPEQRGRYLDIIKFDIVLLVLLVAVWGPYFVTALSPP
jgi:hypothetical protein